MLLFHCFTTCYVFNKEETLAFFRKKTCNSEPKLSLNRKFQDL